MKPSIIRIALVLSVILLLAAGCSPQLKSLLRDLFFEWGVAHAGDLLAYGLTGSSGNTEVDAAMEIKSVISNIKEADKLMEEGRENEDLEKMGEAIEKRPGDYTYRVSAATLMLKTANMADVVDQFNTADELATTYGPSHRVKYATQGIDELESLKPQFSEKGFNNYYQCQIYFQRLSFYYRLRHAQNGSQFDFQQMTRYEEDAKRCKQ